MYFYCINCNCMPHTPTGNTTNSRVRTPKRGGSNQAFYQKNRWKVDSLSHRTIFPLCEVSEHEGKTVASGVSDHIVPIEKGGAPWDWRNRMALCDRYHNIKRSLESRGYCVKTEDTPQGKIPANRQEIINKLIKQSNKRKINVDGSRG